MLRRLFQTFWCSRFKGRSEVDKAASVSHPSLKGANINVIAFISMIIHYEFLPNVTHVQFSLLLEQCSNMINEETVMFENISILS